MGWLLIEARHPARAYLVDLGHRKLQPHVLERPRKFNANALQANSGEEEEGEEENEEEEEDEDDKENEEEEEDKVGEEDEDDEEDEEDDEDDDAMG